MKKTLVLLYNTSCIYEIVILNYFLRFTGKEVVFASLDGKEITSMEGYSINVSDSLSNIAPEEIELMVVPGGDIREIDNVTVWDFLKKVRDNNSLIAGICAGVDVLDHAGILDGIVSTHSADLDVAVADKVITSRANGYVDFAIEVAKKMDLFEDEADLQETIAFWRDYQRMQ
ncbi:MAG: DJ-1/PfpI family protein [Lachnospiraceae bacterium]|nr:DJ-1/PfpI family protein [Lachnospiraceae bacterium]